VTFIIGSQTAGTISNVAGNQYVLGDQHGTLGPGAAPERALERLREALSAARLDEATTRVAAARLAEAAAAIRPAQPDRPGAARALEGLTQALITAGALCSAAVALTGPLQELAAWLGTLGQPLLHLLVGLA
jgi:hypothetical protein